jgi:hypothetical protein
MYTKKNHLPMNVVECNMTNRQGSVLILGTVRHLILVTVMSSDDNWIFDIVEFNVSITDILNRTLATGPCLDSDTVLTVVTDTVQNTDGLDVFSLATLTKRTNTETMTTVTGDVR